MHEQQNVHVAPSRVANTPQRRPNPAHHVTAFVPRPDPYNKKGGTFFSRSNLKEPPSCLARIVTAPIFFKKKIRNPPADRPLPITHSLVPPSDGYTLSADGCRRTALNCRSPAAVWLRTHPECTAPALPVPGSPVLSVLPPTFSAEVRTVCYHAHLLSSQVTAWSASPYGCAPRLVEHDVGLRQVPYNPGGHQVRNNTGKAAPPVTCVSPKS